MMPSFTLHSLTETKLVGICASMTLKNNLSFALWKEFRSRYNEISTTKAHRLFSVQIYKEAFKLSLEAEFIKWACTEVNDLETIPEGMQALIIPKGLYAVFNYKGDLSGAEKMFRFIFEEAIPSSAYEVDQRPHFEILTEKYKHNDPNSEEEIWIPVKPKS